MRLHRLAITGVGPFLSRQEIDFDDLAASGLFLIDGPTGSGKSTIIDSIVYALYGVVAGGGDSDAARMLSHFCSETDPSGVLCEFSVNGRRHRITRIPAGARDPEEPTRAAGSKPARQTLVEYSADGSPITTLVKDREITAHVVGLLGMTADQFRQLVVLPQGQFADLLRMTPNERLTALSSLLGDGFFTQVQNDLVARGAEADLARQAATDDVARAAEQLKGRLLSHLGEAEVDFTDASIADDSRELAVALVLARLAEQATEAEQRRESQAVRTEQARAAAERAREVADALVAVGAAQRAVAEAELALVAADADIDADQVPGRVAALLELQGSLLEPVAWESRAGEREQERQRLSAQVREHAAAAEALRGQRAALPAERTELEARRTAAQKLAGTGPAAVAEAARLSGLADKAGEAQALGPALEALEAERGVATADHERAEAEAHRTRAAWESLVERQRADRAGALAAALVDGEECPVCGSTEHPRPAHAIDTLVSDAEIERAKSTEARAAADAKRSAQAAVNATQAAQEAGQRVAVLAGVLSGQAPEEISALHAAAIEAAQAAVDAEAELAALDTALSELAQRDRALESGISAAGTAEAAARATLDAHVAAEATDEARVRSLVGDAESATALLSVTRQRITVLQALQDAHAALGRAAASVPVDQRGASADAAAATADGLEAEHAAIHASLGLLTEAATQLASVVDESAPLGSAFVSALATRREVSQHTAAAVALAALVNARNPRSLPLRSYALQRRFESVLAAATVHLERMSAGKFSFELSETVGRGNAGLGITVHDSWTGRPQDPKSLSGGETFYASLSLALGLADVVRGEAGGSALETLFIDEGFGSLDQDTLYQVLDQLDQLRAGRRAVGVVSHVTEMKESIPDRLEVRRQADRTSAVTRSGS